MAVYQTYWKIKLIIISSKKYLLEINLIFQNLIF